MAFLLVFVTALGLATRYFPIGNPLWDSHLGDVLWGAALYCAVSLVLRRRRLMVAASLALLVELFKMTGVPARFKYIPPVRWLLGTTFSWHNIPLYLLGIAIAHFVSRCELSKRHRKTR